MRPTIPRAATRCLPALAAVTLCLVAAACSGGGGKSGGSSSGPPSTGADAALCRRPGIADLSTPGTRAQTIVATPPGTRLQSVATDQRYAVWTQVGGSSGTGVVCQQNLTSRAVIVLAHGAVTPLGLASTDDAVYFVTVGSSGGTLYSVDHHGARVHQVADGLTLPIGSSGSRIVFADEPAEDTGRVTMIDSSRDDAIVARYRFPTCPKKTCRPVTSISAATPGLAWMQTPQKGAPGITIRPDSGGGHSRAVDPGTLYPSDNFALYGDPDGYFAWPFSAPRPRPLGRFGGDQMLAATSGHFYLLHTFPDKTQTVLAVSADTGHKTRVDALPLLAGEGKFPLLAGFTAGPSHLCEIVNVFGSDTPTATETPLSAFVRCSLLPRA